VADPILQISGLEKSFGGLVVTDHVDLDVRSHEVHALIGPNGAGKTSLIAQIFGELAPDRGAILWCGDDITRLPTFERVRRGLARTFQISSVLPELTALENVLLAVLSRKSPNPDKWSRVSANRSATERAFTHLERVGLDRRAGVSAAALSYGERRQLEVAIALALEPRLLLLDEPMAGVGPEETSQLRDLLDGLRRDCAILLVEHDMDVVFAIADRVSVLVSGRVIACGPPTTVRDDARVRQAYFGEEDAW